MQKNAVPVIPKKCNVSKSNPFFCSVHFEWNLSSRDGESPKLSGADKALAHTTKVNDWHSPPDSRFLIPDAPPPAQSPMGATPMY